MCGIVGLWQLDGAPVDQGMLDHFTDSLAHRGPDGRGTYLDVEAGLGLGHRRLAILDTSEAGQEPMPYADQRYWISFNGEIYNFVELKAKLASQGYCFRTHTDTEVILAAYDCWGEDCQLRFNGMWAFAIWDRHERKLFLSRDRFGVKPLHYYYDGARFAFASEMKAFLELDWFDPEFDPEMVAAALCAYWLVEGTERCLLRDLVRLPCGYCLTVTATNAPKARRWWNTLEHLQRVPTRYEDQVERYRELFLDACRIRMRSDVPLGTALSGGLDSGSMLCGMHRIRKGLNGDGRLATDWQRAFVATYPNAVEDEKKYADEVIRHTGVEALYSEIHPEMLFDHFDEVLFQFEEISDIHIGPWLVYKNERAFNVVVSLDGHGGDESLGGYYYHVNAAIRDALLPWPHPRRLRDLKATMLALDLYPNEQDYNMPSYKKMLGRLAQDGICIAKGQISALLPARRRRSGAATAEWRDPWLLNAPPRFSSPGYEVDQATLRRHNHLFKELYNSFHYIDLPTNLRDYDRLSMAHGVEVRSPFMDWRLVCFTFSLPSTCKIGRGVTKKILRDAMKGILPESIRTRTRKGGFVNPGGDWFANKAESFIQDAVASREFQASPIWDGKRIAAEVDTAFKERNYIQIQKAWTFVQAMQLMKMFRDPQWRRQ